MMSPGAYLKQMRERLGLSVRQVERLSEIIAGAQRSKEYFISHGWLTKLEKGQSMPGIHALFSLSVIYRTSLAELHSLYNIPMPDSREYTQLVKLLETHPVSKGISAISGITSPHKPPPREPAPVHTSSLMSLLEQSGDIPIAVLEQLGIQIGRYGFIGLNDYTLYPMLRPGALVLIDEGQNKVVNENWSSEHDRPIYFLELQSGFACGWCILEGDLLTLIPHHNSPSPPQQYHYPREVRIIGRIVSAFSHLYHPKGKSLPSAHSPSSKRKRPRRRQ